MSITVAQAVAKIDADDSGLKSRFEGIKGKLGEAGGWFGSFGATVAGVFTGGAIIAGVTGLVSALGDMVKNGAAANEGIAQTGAVLKSTGGAAGVTADHVDALSTQLMNLTGIQDDTVRGAQNMLLTFENVGSKGGVFDQATKTALDMSVALGQNATQSAMQLGKALNDPEKGITALQRVGVTFTQTQKDLIANYMKHGQTAKAQGVILQELSKEFGGSAAAAGQANGGVKILAAQFDNMKQTIGQAVIPILSDLLGGLQPLITSIGDWLPGAIAQATIFFNTKIMPVFSKLYDWIIYDGVPAFQRIAAFIMNNVVPALQHLWSWAQQYIVPILMTAAHVVITNVVPALQTIWTSISENLLPALQRLWEKLSPILIPALQLVGWVLQNVVGPALGVVLLIVGKVIDAIAWLIGKIGDLIGWLGSMKDNIGSALSILHQLHIPGFAAGGIMAASGMAMVGEHGPELVYLPAGAHVMNAAQTAAMASGNGNGSARSASVGDGGSGQPIIIQIHVAGRHVADALMPDIVRAARLATGLKI